MFSDRDKQAARVVVSIFETGKKTLDPAALAVLADKAGISYGMFQATHRSGTLFAVVKAYSAKPGAQVPQLGDYLLLLQHFDPASVDALSRDSNFKKLAIAAGRDPLMRETQIEVFDKLYLNKAVQACDGSNFVEALSLTTIFDSMNQGGYDDCRDAVKVAPDERAWVRAYIDEREGWLESAPKRIRDQKRARVIANSVYRPQALRQLAVHDNWSLQTPFVVRGIMVEEQDLQ